MTVVYYNKTQRYLSRHLSPLSCDSGDSKNQSDLAKLQSMLAFFLIFFSFNVNPTHVNIVKLKSKDLKCISFLRVFPLSCHTSSGLRRMAARTRTREAISRPEVK